LGKKKGSVTGATRSKSEFTRTGRRKDKDLRGNKSKLGTGREHCGTPGRVETVFALGEVAGGVGRRWTHPPERRRKKGGYLKLRAAQGLRAGHLQVYQGPLCSS